MPRPPTGRPTDLELEILKVLWEHGPSTVRAVWQHLAAEREIGQTTVLKIMQIMRDKDLLICDVDQRPQVYRPRHPQKTTLKMLASDLLNRAFEGSVGLLLMHAVDSRKTSPEELEQIRRLLKQFDAD